MDTLESQIGQWRQAVTRGRAVDAGDADELEGHLRDQVADLRTAGLSDDEAFLIAVKRLGEVNVITAEYAREHGDRLWKQLAMPDVDEGGRRPVLMMLGFAVVAGLLLQAARLISGEPESDSPRFVRDLGLFVLPVLAGYFAYARRLPRRSLLPLAGAVAIIAVAINVFPFRENAATTVLVAIHLPIVLWFAVGFAYTGGDVRSSAKRMDFIRFSGEWVIYLALIALGGGVLVGLSVFILSPIAPGAIEEVLLWVVPSGIAGAVIVAAWLVEEKKSVIQNLAPVLTAIFTPLFALMLLVSAAVYLVSGIGREFDRDLLIVFDLLLLVVLGLVVYGISARSPGRTAGLMDVLRLVAVGAAIVLDVLVLVSMFARVGDLGFTANRVAALGLNLVLLANLAGTTWLIGRMLAGKVPVARLEQWQTGYLSVFAAWVIVVVLVVPAMFGFQ